MLKPGLMNQCLAHALCLGTAVALLAGASSTQAAAGRFQFVYGEVRITSSDGRERAATRGTEVDEGDTISTTGRGTAQLRMADGAALAVRPRSQVRIDAYQFDNKPDSDRSFLSLLRGTLRSITGLVGRANRGSYRVRTPTATIGIRGSDADIGFNPENGLTAVRTYAGGHSLTAPDANGVPTTIDTNPGQIAIASPGQPPTFSNSFPFATPAPRAGAPGTQQARQPQARGQGGTPQGPNAPSSRQRAIANANQRSSVQGQIPRGSFAFSNPKIAPFGTAVAGALLVNDGVNKEASTGTVVANNVGTIVLDGANRPIAVTDTNPQGGIQIFRNNAPLVGPTRAFEVRDLSGEVVSRGNWGAYSSNLQVVDNAVPQNVVSNFHFIAATNRTSPAQVQALGGTGFSYIFPPNQLNFSNELGNFASTRSASASGTFNGTISITAAASGFGGGSDGWSLNTAGIPAVDKTVAKFLGNAGVKLNVAAPGGTFEATASGRFVGAQAEGVIMSLSARETTSGIGIVGTGVGFQP